MMCERWCVHFILEHELIRGFMWPSREELFHPGTRLQVVKCDDQIRSTHLSLEPWYKRVYQSSNNPVFAWSYFYLDGKCPNKEWEDNNN